MKQIIILLMIGMYSGVYAQHIPDPAMNRDFAAQVKTIEEFIMRFNGDASNPEIPNDAGRKQQLLGLFDYQMNHEGMSDSIFREHIKTFVQKVEKSGISLKMIDAEMYAEVETNAVIAGKTVSISIIMQTQSYKENRNRWAIVGIKGLTKAGVVDIEKFFPISPVDHETHFMSISDIFAHNNPEIMGYRGKNTRIDELSVFLSFSMMGQVKIEQVTNLTMHCLEVPEYSFTINEYGRRGTNSGWLISKLIKFTNNKQKQEYLTKKLGL